MLLRKKENLIGLSLLIIALSFSSLLTVNAETHKYNREKFALITDSSDFSIKFFNTFNSSIIIKIEIIDELNEKEVIIKELLIRENSGKGIKLVGNKTINIYCNDVFDLSFRIIWFPQDNTGAIILTGLTTAGVSYSSFRYYKLKREY